MKRSRGFGARGFALLEALIALLVAALALAAVVRLQGAITKGSGEAVARSEALTLAQERMEQLRAQAATWPGFTNLASEDCADVAVDRSTNAAFQRCVTVANTGALDARDVTVRVQWNDTDGVQQAIVLASTIGWDDPLGQALAARPPTGTMIAPVGAAKRPPGKLSFPGGVANPDGITKIKQESGTTYLTNDEGDVLIYLDPLANGEAQDFTVLYGRVYFDLDAGNKVPPLTDNNGKPMVEIRLSSEGYCAQDPTKAARIFQVTTNGRSYQYFEYWCYVGPGWYGNVGVNISDAANGGQAQPAICAGDPTITNNGTTTSPNAQPAATRTYRGFQYVGGNLFSTGVKGGSFYPRIERAGAAGSDPNLGMGDGAPLPSEFGAHYVPSGATEVPQSINHFRHDFLITNLSGQETCAQKMAVDEFSRNAGKYYCIKPHHVASSPVCPTVWPNFGAGGGGGGVTQYLLEVTTTGLGSVSSSVGGIDCDSSCAVDLASGTEVVLTAKPASGQTFQGWSGACESAGVNTTCTLTMNSALAVGADFTGESTVHKLTVSRSGTGALLGTVTGTGIDCGTDCTETYQSPTSIALAASAQKGAKFMGWSGGGCSGTGTCTVSVSGAVGVVARFSLDPCETVVTGSIGDVNRDMLAPEPNGSGSCRKESKNATNFECTLKALEGEAVTLRAQLGQGAGATIFTVPVTASCSAQQVNFPPP